jgi:hypothetical protein
MTNDTDEFAAMQFVRVGNSGIGFRRFGRPTSSPLLLVNHLAAQMDEQDS